MLNAMDETLLQKKQITPAYILRKYFLFYVALVVIAGSFYGGCLYGKEEVTLPVSSGATAQAASGGRVVRRRQRFCRVSRGADATL